MSRQNDASSALLRVVCERRSTRFRNAFTRDLILTAKYNDDFDDSGWRTEDLSSGEPNENKLSDTGMSRSGVVGSKDTWRMVCELGCAMVTRASTRTMIEFTKNEQNTSSSARSLKAVHLKLLCSHHHASRRWADLRRIPTGEAGGLSCLSAWRCRAKYLERLLEGELRHEIPALCGEEVALPM